MGFRTILTVAGLEPGDHDIELAAGLCEEVGAHLSVLVTAIAAPPPIGEYAAVVSQAWLEERQSEMESLEARAAEISALVAARGGSADVTSEFAELAWADEAIGRRARYADITVLGPQLEFDDQLRDKVIAGALFASGKPLLLVPEGAVPTLKPKRVVVGWDARIEASRAVRESLSVLRGAAAVHVTLVDPGKGEDRHGAEPGADIAAYLSRHGVKVTVDRLPSEDRSTADVLTQHATDLSADLLVMGAYGHSRLRERLFGGVTRSVLESPKLPTLLAH
jgi:nucleotide-binding universal stress UspA family protein